jgi:hypothetical protein
MQGFVQPIGYVNPCGPRTGGFTIYVRDFGGEKLIEKNSPAGQQNRNFQRACGACHIASIGTHDALCLYDPAGMPFPLPQCSAREPDKEQDIMVSAWRLGNGALHALTVQSVYSGF